MKNIKKIILSSILFGVSLPTLAIILEPNTITNKTGIPVTIDTVRHLKCLGNNIQTITQSTTIGAGQKGKIYVKGGAQYDCVSNATELKADALGYEPAILENPPAKDYTISLQIAPPPFKTQISPIGRGKIPIAPPLSPSQPSVIKKLIFE